MKPAAPVTKTMRGNRFLRRIHSLRFTNHTAEPGRSRELPWNGSVPGKSRNPPCRFRRNGLTGRRGTEKNTCCGGIAKGEGRGLQILYPPVRIRVPPPPLLPPGA